VETNPMSQSDPIPAVADSEKKPSRPLWFSAVFVLGLLTVGGCCIIRQKAWIASSSEPDTVGEFLGLEAVAIGLISILLAALEAAEVIQATLKRRGWKVKSIWFRVFQRIAMGFVVICLVYAFWHGIIRH
jgi:hypothetical protein